MPEIDVLRVRAEAGDADAQHSLGNMYHYGLGIPQDDVEAGRWYRLAAEQGVARAQPAEEQALLSAGDQIDEVHETHVRHASSSNSSCSPSHFHKCSPPRANSGPITLSTVWMKWLSPGPSG